MKQTINIRQCGIILIMCIFANKLLLMPSLLYTNVKADGIFVTAIPTENSKLPHIYTPINGEIELYSA